MLAIVEAAAKHTLSQFALFFWPRLELQNVGDTRIVH